MQDEKNKLDGSDWTDVGFGPNQQMLYWISYGPSLTG
jgi:hypothetical protein